MTLAGIALGTWLTFVPPDHQTVQITIGQDRATTVHVACETFGGPEHVRAYTRDEGEHSFYLAAGVWLCYAIPLDNDTVIWIGLD